MLQSSKVRLVSNGFYQLNGLPHRCYAFGIDPSLAGAVARSPRFRMAQAVSHARPKDATEVLRGLSEVEPG